MYVSFMISSNFNQLPNLISALSLQLSINCLEKYCFLFIFFLPGKKMKFCDSKLTRESYYVATTGPASSSFSRNTSCAIWRPTCIITYASTRRLSSINIYKSYQWNITTNGKKLLWTIIKDVCLSRLAVGWV